jgi:thioredoxin 1
MSIIHLSDHNFKKEVLDCNLPVLVDFWATWCGPCKMIAPIIEELAKEYKDRIKVAKLDIDEGSQVANKYGVMSIPTIMFFKDGKILSHAVGALGKAGLKRKIEEAFLA